MQIEKQFYENLHIGDTQYGLCRYDVGRLIATPAIGSWLERIDKSSARMLDIGCGKGQFLLDFTETMQKTRGQFAFSQITALDLIQTQENVLDQISPAPKFVQQSVDGQKLPFGDGTFELVTCNHVLEHLFETENLVREILRVTSSKGLVVISVPNVAAWMNRIAFLFGGQPLGSEVGTESVSYGFWPVFLQERLKQFRPSGHVRDFTPRSLKDLTTSCGFEFVGWWAQNGGFLPTLTRNLGILLKPRK